MSASRSKSPSSIDKAGSPRQPPGDASNIDDDGSKIPLLLQSHSSEDKNLRSTPGSSPQKKNYYKGSPNETPDQYGFDSNI